MQEFNLRLFYAINRWPAEWSPFLRFFSEATQYAWFKLLLLWLIAHMIAVGGRARPTAIQALLAFPLANGFTDLLKNFLPEPRPFQELHDVILRAGWSPSHGTASAHSANMAAVALVFTYRLKGWGGVWIAIAILTGISRVYVGVHYPYQVLLGWICGIVAALLVVKVADLIAERRRQASGKRPTTETEASPAEL